MLVHFLLPLPKRVQNHISEGLLKPFYYSSAEARRFEWKNESLGKMIHCILTRVPEKGYKLSSEYFTILYQGGFRLCLCYTQKAHKQQQVYRSFQ